MVVEDERAHVREGAPRFARRHVGAGSPDHVDQHGGGELHRTGERLGVGRDHPVETQRTPADEPVWRLLLLARFLGLPDAADASAFAEMRKFSISCSGASATTSPAVS